MSKLVERGNRFGTFIGKDFHQLSNFKIDYIHEVRAGNCSGFLCTVTLFNGRTLGYVIGMYAGTINIILLYYYTSERVLWLGIARVCRYFLPSRRRGKIAQECNA